ncbi:MAG TPA: DAK2 domain-containing protein [Acidimicrobiales bacterium]|nr:DAK2 domain-containing protein [Acidimicrobiales bacterium]
MDPLDRLAAADVRAAMVAFRDGLRAHQEAINRLNVYPVPDGDTGTNMALTLEAVVTELEALGEPGIDMGAVCKAVAHGSLMGARGNSGVILSQILRGACDVLRGLESAGPSDMAAALVDASTAAEGAVMRPVQGTILTVAADAATAARAEADRGGALVQVLDAARVAAKESVDRTPELLSVLKEAGVVDAGGVGFVLLLDALLLVVDGRPVPAPEEAAVAASGSATTSSRSTVDQVGATAEPGAAGECAEEIGDLRYEVMYLLEAPDGSIPAFKDVWAGVGDSIVVVGGEGLWNCHIHTDDIGAAVEAGIDCGRPRNIRVTDLMDQVQEERWVREAAAQAPSEEEGSVWPVPNTAVVAVATGTGIGRIFRSLGVHQMVAGGQSMNPSTAQILEAVEAAPADEVVVLPNNGNIVPVAEQVDALTSKRVRVVKTSSVAEGFAALLEYDPEAGVESNVGVMSTATERVIAGEVTRAVRASDSPAGPIAEGDWMGISKRGIEVVQPTLAEATTALLEKLLTDENEIVTLIEGEGSTPASTRQVTEWLGEHRPDIDVEIHHGDQPLYPYLLSID